MTQRRMSHGADVDVVRRCSVWATDGRGDAAADAATSPCTLASSASLARDPEAR
jgi:hypothetical protein